MGVERATGATTWRAIRRWWSLGLANEPDWPRCLRLASFGALIGAGLVVIAIVCSPDPVPGGGGGYTALYSPPTDGFGVLLNHADGQAYASLAQDPALERPWAFLEGPKAASIFGARPVFPYLLWIGSMGQPAALPVAFVVVEGLAAGLLVLGSAAVLHALGRRPLDQLALATLGLPGALIGLMWLGPDVLAVGLALLALVCWCGARPRYVPAAALFTAAVLTRETMVVFVGVALVNSWLRRRPRRGDLLLALPVLAYLAWSTFVGHRFSARVGRTVSYNSGLPFVGVVSAARGWEPVGLAIALALLILVGVSLLRPANPLLTLCVVAYGLALACAAERVWDSWQSGVRVALPLTVVALLNVRFSERMEALGWAGLSTHRVGDGAVSP